MDTPATYPEGWQLVLNEQFANLDAWSNRDNVVYQDTLWIPENVTLEAGVGMRLVGSDVLIDGKYQGALAFTTAEYNYGFFESSFKFPSGYIWPAFFLYDNKRFTQGADKNEIDVVEWLGTNIIYITTHIVDDSFQQTFASINLSGGFHTWGLYWDADVIRIYLDSHLIYENTAQAQIPQVTMNIMFQWSFGGWANPPTNVTFPAYLDVAYVKYWQKVNR